MKEKVPGVVVRLSDFSLLLIDNHHYLLRTQNELFSSRKFPMLGFRRELGLLSILFTDQIHYQKFGHNSKLKDFCTVDLNCVDEMRRISMRPESNQLRVFEEPQQKICCPLPLFILTISLLQIVLFFYNEAVSDGNFHECSPLIFNPTKRYEIWRYQTYMFIHSGYLHLIINVFSQIALGLPLEKAYGSWKILLIYLSGVLAGSLGTSIFIPDVYLSGSSSGTYALILAHFATTIINFREAWWRWPRLLFVLGFCISEAIVFFCKDLSQEIPVSHPAHFSGACAGFLLGMVLLTTHPSGGPCRICIQWISFAMFFILLGAGITFSIVKSDYFKNAIANSFVLLTQKSCY